MMKSTDIMGALRGRYKPPEWAIFFEVANATGGLAAGRADAIAMNLWPSRGLAIHGFEIKVSRSDWARERANPAKAEVMAKNCDFWWVVAPVGIVDDSDLPLTWGLLTVTDNYRVRQVVAAEKTDVVPLERPFLASLVRATGRLDEEDIALIVEDRVALERERFDYRVETAVDQRTRAFAHEAKLFEVARGVLGDRLTWLNEEDFARAIAMVLESGIAGSYGGLESLATQADHFAARLRKTAEGLGLSERGDRLGAEAP